MPCNSDYMDPSRAELNSRKVAKHILFVIEQLSRYKGIIPKPKMFTIHQVTEAAKDMYGNTNLLPAMTEYLCSLVSGMGNKQRDTIVYNGKNKNSRILADWWDEHVEADKERIRSESAESLRKSIAAAARAKLSLTERKALGIS